MKQSLNRLVLFALALAFSYVLVYLGWTKDGSFFELAFASLVSLLAVTWSLRQSPEGVWPAPVAGPLLMRPLPVYLPTLSGNFGVVLGVALIGTALVFSLQNWEGAALFALLAGALCWRPYLSLDTPPRLGRRELIVLMTMIMALAVAFRFYKAGSIPAGMITVDEPRLMADASGFVDGERQTFYVSDLGTAGCVPLWIEAASMWLFGRDILGFRMSTLLPGLAVVGLVALLGLELAGARFGLLAGAFTAICVWPVSFSRAEYWVSSSLVPMVAAPWLFLRGLRRRSVGALVLCGFCLGLMFNIYNPGRLVPLLLLLLGAFLWFGKPQWRESLRHSVLPIFGGLLIGLAPLVLWAAKDPAFAYKAYFANIDAAYIAGQNVVAAHGLFDKFDLAFGRILPYFPRILTMFTVHGGMRNWYFRVDQPVVDRATLFFLLCGIAACLIRFRQPAFAFILVWWLLGLTPTLLADPSYHFDERRIMLAMPPTMLIAALGFESCMQLAGRGLRRGMANRILLIGSLIFFSGLALRNWHTYFVDINQDRDYLDANHANLDNTIRGIFLQNKISPVSVISFWKPVPDHMWGASEDNELEEHWDILRPIPSQFAEMYDENYLEKGGFLGQLEDPGADFAKRDPLIVLDPFHLYLQPFLEKELGGSVVDDIAPVQANDGPDYYDVAFAHDPLTANRLIRVQNFKAAEVKALKERWSFPFTVAQLLPPPSVRASASISHLFLLNPEAIQLTENYVQNPRNWAILRTSNFSITDVWFWLPGNNFPGGVQAPLNLRANWVLNVPSDGTYSFGASASDYTSLKIDGKTVYSYLPVSREQATESMDGIMGSSIALKAGLHRFNLSQFVLNYSGNSNNLIRVIWKRPDGSSETLPIQYLFPNLAEAKQSLKP